MTVVCIVCLLAAFIMSVMFSGAELAIATISRDSVERLVALKNTGANVTLTMIGNKRRFLIMLMVGRIVSVVAGTAILVRFGMNIATQIGMSVVLGGVIGAVAAVVLFIATEGVLASLISTGEYEKRVSRFGWFLIIFHVIFYPVTTLIDRLLSSLIKETVDLAAREEAFLEMVKSQSESGVIEEEESEMIRSIFEFSDTTVREVMVPRIDVVAAEKTATIDELLDLFEQKGHSRIPIYDERIDNIIGLIYAKDLLLEIASKGKENLTIAAIIREGYFVPENKSIADLLKEFKQAKVHIAIVVDEYGGTAGIVALEDLLEEIVGEIQDEYDAEDERDYIRVSDHSFIMDAGLDIDDVNDIIRSDIPNADFDTLGGFIYNQLGFIPEGGEVVNWEHYTFTISEINGNRISKVLVEIHEFNGKKTSDNN